jgi:hypothetical protein
MNNQSPSELLEAVIHECVNHQRSIGIILEQAKEEIAQTGAISEYSSKTMVDVLEKTKSTWHEIEDLVRTDKND